MDISISKVQQFLDWMKTKIYLDAMSGNASKRLVKRGQIYRCNFGIGIGSEMQKDRPAIIIQNNIGNRNSGNTIVVPITHDTSDLPCMVSLTTQYEADGVTVKVDGQANTSNIMCISKARIGEYVGKVSTVEMRAIDVALAKAIGIMSYYSNLTKKMEDKLTYIARVKQERNEAQDQLKEIRSIFHMTADSDIVLFLKNVKENLDKQEKSK